MKKLCLWLALGAVVAAGPATADDDRHVPGDRFPAAAYGGAPLCSSDVFCSSDSLEAGFVADGEYDPVNLRAGFVTTLDTIMILDLLCGVTSQSDITGPDFPNPSQVFPAVRSFAWGLGA
ncbi:MAG TPA: hypothetical protein VNM87_06220, partial [Candidatus Udaeobacter sp.]|nr:hypothetical protein [Candidatus Udaeobacter sp.]